MSAPRRWSAANGSRVPAASLSFKIVNNKDAPEIKTNGKVVAL